MSIRQIEPRFVPKVWGSTHLEPWFANTVEKTGEVWFPVGELLIKFLFTTEHLSVQVHPDDDYAARHENSRGKTEMWHILRAESDARVALGFKRPMSRDRVREFSESGELMEHLEWRPARAGDTFFTPAGTVHAIGSGLALCEIQQNSDVTYRLFDYGRPRELHLDRAMDVADCGCHEGPRAPQKLAAGRELLVDCPHFRTERWEIASRTRLEAVRAVIAIEGAGKIEGESFRAGMVWEVEAGATVESAGCVLLTTTV